MAQLLVMSQSRIDLLLAPFTDDTILLSEEVLRQAARARNINPDVLKARLAERAAKYSFQCDPEISIDTVTGLRHMFMSRDFLKLTAPEGEEPHG